jgi:hypothetical protein
VPGYTDFIQCPKCEGDHFVRDVWLSTGEFTRSCLGCGYFEEGIAQFRLNGEEINGGYFQFNRKTGLYERKGFKRKNGSGEIDFMKPEVEDEDTSQESLYEYWKPYIDAFFEKIDKNREAFFKKLDELENEVYADVFIDTHDGAQQVLDFMYSRELFPERSNSPLLIRRLMNHCVRCKECWDKAIAIGLIPADRDMSVN